MDAGLNQNQAVFGVLVLAVALQVLAHSDGLLDQVVKILRDFRSKTYRKRGCLSSKGNVTTNT